MNPNLDEWQQMGYHVLKEFERLDQVTKEMNDKVTSLQLRVATYAGAAGVLGGSLALLAKKVFE